MEKGPEGCDCDKCNHDYPKAGGGFCNACAGWHISVLRHTVARLKGEWCMIELVEAGGLLKRNPPKYSGLP